MIINPSGIPRGIYYIHEKEYRHCEERSDMAIPKMICKPQEIATPVCALVRNDSKCNDTERIREVTKHLEEFHTPSVR